MRERFLAHFVSRARHPEARSQNQDIAFSAEPITSWSRQDLGALYLHANPGRSMYFSLTTCKFMANRLLEAPRKVEEPLQEMLLQYLNRSSLTSQECHQILRISS